MPRNLHELQRLHGLLQYFKPYIRRYNEIMHPVISLLARSTAPWTARHTAVVRQVVRELVEHSGVRPPNFAAAFEVHVSMEEGSYFAALVQPSGVVQYASTRRSAAQARLPPAEAYLHAVHWAVIAFRHYLHFVP